MNTSQRFLRFAAECELMAKFTPSPENEQVWRRMAEKWIQCAELCEQQDSSAHTAVPNKRRQKPEKNSVH